jgi:hypothetical protein
MNTQVNLYTTSDIGNFLDLLFFEYSKSKDKKLLPKIIKLSSLLSSKIRRSLPIGFDLSDDDFDKETSLTLISRFIIGRNVTPSKDSMYKIITQKNSKFRPVVSHLSDVSLPIYNDFKIDSVLLLDDSINECISDLPQSLKILLLYFLFNPGNVRVYISKEPNSITKILVLVRLFKLRRLIMDNESNLEKVSFPTNNISKVYILSALYKFDPSLLVMILLMEDLTKFFQFISLFENKSINVPKISDVYSLFEECKLLMSNFEDDSLSIRDRESLALLSTDCNNISDLSADSKLNPYLEVFFE